MAGVKKNIAMKVAMATVTEAVRMATDAMHDMTDALVAMATTLRRIEKLLDEQTDYLVETKQVIEDKADQATAKSA